MSQSSPWGPPQRPAFPPPTGQPTSPQPPQGPQLTPQSGTGTQGQFPAAPATGTQLPQAPLPPYAPQVQPHIQSTGHPTTMQSGTLPAGQPSQQVRPQQPYGQPQHQQPQYAQYARVPTQTYAQPLSSSWATQSRPSWQPVAQPRPSYGAAPLGSPQTASPYPAPPVATMQRYAPYGQFTQGGARPYGGYIQPGTPWQGQYYSPTQWQPPKQGLSARTVIVLVLVSCIIVSILAGSFISSVVGSDTTTVTGQTSSTTPTNTTVPTQGQETQYTPAPPDPNPAAPPFPAASQIDALLENNPFYAQTVPITSCQLGDVDLVNGSVSDIETHMNDFVVCLMQAWYPVVTAAGYELPRPSVTVYTYEMSTACGEVPLGNAVYCSADQQIYYAKDLIEFLPSQIHSMRFLAESIIAHEFGHALQYRTQILMSEVLREEDAMNEVEQMEWSRRTEMQADCLAGTFMSSIKDSVGLTPQDEENIGILFNLLGGSTPYSDDHGTGENRQAWTIAGMTSTSVATCNTFIASAESVG